LTEKEEFEEIEYEPESVRELLTEMMDTSELVVDLAYSAVIFDSKEIEEEVYHLESRMDTLLYRIRLASMLAARTPEEAEQLSGVLQVAGAAEKISDAAGDIADLLSSDLAVRPFLPNILKGAEECIRRCTIEKGSEAVGQTIGDLAIESETGARIVAIRRGKRWIYGPDGGTRLRDGDTLITRGTDDGCTRLQRFMSGKAKGI